MRSLQFDTLRLRLIKIAARVGRDEDPNLPTSCPNQRILRIVLDRIPRLLTEPTGRRRPERQTRRPQPATPRLPSRRLTAVPEGVGKRHCNGCRFRPPKNSSVFIKAANALDTLAELQT
ncbi:hypothetical protein [Mesorhizobium sp. M0768]|uniref:hypothetical protein n=1 Tax=Mesorhizobium sp. M0768 TaxID=2956996 RepID=UPI0033360915